MGDATMASQLPSQWSACDGLSALRYLTEDDIRDLLFETWDVAENFFKIYAAFHGFSIRKEDSRKLVSGQYSMKKWVCSREGFSRPGTVGSGKRYSTTRVGCKCYLRVNVGTDRQWYVGGLHLAHNHDLVDNALTCFMKSNRSVSEADLVMVDSMFKVGFRQCDIYQFLAAVSGGPDRIGFMQKDMNNVLRRSRYRTSGQSADMEAAVAYLKSKNRDDPGMTMVADVHDGLVRRLFWADTQMKLDFQAFGDVVAFDSTFNTNAYGMQMVVMVGVNHHHQTIVLSTALLETETTDDYKWFLQTHTAAMSGSTPVSVVTDADRAMIAAIREVWPTVHHRLCIWHFKRNMVRHVRDVGRRAELSAILSTSDTAEAVEERWVRWVSTTSDSISRQWIRQTYANRKMIWQCYLRGHFWAELHSTQRCERMHRYMKGYLGTSYRLHEYLHHYERAVVNLRHTEMQAEYKTVCELPQSTSALKLLEEHARNVYTRESFQRITTAFKNEALWYVHSFSGPPTCRTYVLRSFETANPDVTLYSCIGTIELTCSCLHLETVGLPCAHHIHICKVEGRSTLPANVILKRWTKEARRNICTINSGGCGLSLADVRRGALMAACHRISGLACNSTEKYKEVHDMLTTLTGRLAGETNHDTGTHKKAKRQLWGETDLPFEMVTFGGAVSDSISTPIKVREKLSQVAYIDED